MDFRVLRSEVPFVFAKKNKNNKYKKFFLKRKYLFVRGQTIWTKLYNWKLC